MPNQYTSLTRDNILRKVGRKRNPVQSITKLAEEFGRDTTYVRRSGPRAGRIDTRPPSSFVKEVKQLVGEEVYNQLRAKPVNAAFHR